MAHALKGDLGTPLADRLVAGLPVIDGEADADFLSTALALRSELVALCTRHNRAGGGATAVDPEYLEVIALRA